MGDSHGTTPEASRSAPSRWRKDRPDRVLGLPIRPEVRGFNPAGALAIAVFEAVRQINSAQPTCE
jgi:tRNA(Leu) C34 or U34 (ribose-2'-O)-methylase TrmL